MKLSQLNVAIRDADSLKIQLRLSDDDTEGLTIHLQKTPLLTALKAKFVERGAETGLYLSETGFFMKESNRPDEDL